MSLLSELKRRNVLQLAAFYVVGAWVAIQGADLAFPGWCIPDSSIRHVWIAAVLGLPIAFIFSWRFDITRQGLEHTPAEPGTAVSRTLSTADWTVLIGLGALALALIGVSAQNILATRDCPSDRTFADSAENRPVVTSINKLSKSQVFLPPVTSPFPLVVDDSRIYFTHFPGPPEPYGFAQMARTGGELQAFETPFDSANVGVVPESLSPDKSALIVNVFDLDSVEPDEIWEVPVAGGSPRKITDGYQWALSPDGKTMAFRRDLDEVDGPNLYLANADASDATKVFSGRGRNLYWLQFSPDGERLRFTWFRDSGGEIWEYSLEEGTAYQVMPGWDAKNVCCGSWTPDGKYYVFEAIHEAESQIWAVADETTATESQAEPFRLTYGTLEFKRPTIPETGNSIYAIGWLLRGEVVEQAPDEARFHAIEGLESTSIEQVDFSKDGDLVAYVSYPEGHLWTKKLSTGSTNQLTFGSTKVARPKISPDGSTIAYEGWLLGGNKKVFTIDIAGGDSVLVSNAEAFSWAPSWSPDGTKLVFSENSDSSPKIYDMLLAATTDLGLAEPFYYAAWSPDGLKLAGKSKKRVVMYRFDTGAIEVLANDTDRSVANWSDDSNRIYLLDPWNAHFVRWAYSLDIRNKRMIKITEFGSERTVWGTWEQWVGVRPDGTVMLLRDYSIHNIYELQWDPG